MNWLRWKQGRTSPYNYKKMLLFCVPTFFDVYLLHFPVGSSVDWHTDPINEKFKHYRVNFFIKKAKKGGQLMRKLLVLDGEKRGAVNLILRYKSRLTFMRPDIVEHAVSPVQEGSAWVLSIGWTFRSYAVDSGPR